MAAVALGQMGWRRGGYGCVTGKAVGRPAHAAGIKVQRVCVCVRERACATLARLGVPRRGVNITTLHHDDVGAVEGRGFYSRRASASILPLPLAGTRNLAWSSAAGAGHAGRYRRGAAWRRDGQDIIIDVHRARSTPRHAPPRCRRLVPVSPRLAGLAAKGGAARCPVTPRASPAATAPLRCCCRPLLESFPSADIGGRRHGVAPGLPLLRNVRDGGAGSCPPRAGLLANYSLLSKGIGKYWKAQKAQSLIHEKEKGLRNEVPMTCSFFFLPPVCLLAL